jgi:hypothetical protein
MLSAFGRPDRSFGDAGGFGDVLIAPVVVRRPHVVHRADTARNDCGGSGFGDSAGFGDAGGFDYGPVLRPVLRRYAPRRNTP